MKAPSIAAAAGPALNLSTGSKIRVVVGWGELDYAYDKDATFITNYGFDNPINFDLGGGANAVDQQYLVSTTLM